MDKIWVFNARDRVLKSYIVFILLFDENIKLYGSNDTLIYNSKHCNTQKIVKIFVPENKFNVVKLWLKSVSVQRFRSIIFSLVEKEKIFIILQRAGSCGKLFIVYSSKQSLLK